MPHRKIWGGNPVIGSCILFITIKLQIIWKILKYKRPEILIEIGRNFFGNSFLTSLIFSFDNHTLFCIPLVVKHYFRHKEHLFFKVAPYSLTFYN